MPFLNPPAELQQFIDDELLRMPLVVDQTIDGTVDHLRQSLPTLSPQPRASAADVLQAIGTQRDALTDYYLRSLRRQLAERSATGSAAGGAGLPATLSLVDEDSVAIDVEISHVIELIRSTAEYELRELQTFTAALVGDMDLARDHNPFGPAQHARALWAAAQALPLSRGHHLLFMRNAAPALAAALRRAYAASSSRLEGQGVTPAAYRTMILPSGARRSRRPEISLGAGLDLVRSAVSPAAELGFDDAPALALEPALSVPPGATDAPPAERRAIELLTGLFDAMLADRRIAQDIALMLSRLQSVATRLVLREPKALEDEGHTMWRFFDDLAHLGEVLPPSGQPERGQTLRFAQGLVEHLAAEPAPNASLFEWASERLQHQAQHRFARRCTDAAAQIAELQRIEERLCSSAAPPSTLGGALDIAQLDTVPADLMPADGPGEPRDAQAWLQARRPADWLHVFLQGRWVKAQVLWPGELGELWLVGDAESPETWAVRRRALLTLRTEGLLATLKPRSLVRSAAKRVMRRSFQLG
ncbi:DUF1631 family protein [Rubrivivax gelatinosus]|uniref:Uncharacterized protein DUF1631 n=1 Tax=Rubrivivax gelatinosus TaxID=28068 RepID=A0A4R2M709_RUBGE|nr:DUF1631 family protein [Rubrivivax gelatinosus]MBK1687161.1 hypothetical protein [Rubrivivax gelatinosus]TCP00675.1 uncharacterized protein DUF1631 [Rubrivivax gelatinosus]